MNMIQNLDNIILEYIQLHMKSPILDELMPLITSLGNKLTIWFIIALILLTIKKYRIFGVLIVCSMLLCLIVGNLTLKPLIARIRPFDVRPLVNAMLIPLPSDFSFPSGHTMSAFTSATILFYMNKKIGVLAFLVAGLIGFSRLYLYVHYPSDVFCGVLIGVAMAIFIIIVFNYLRKKGIGLNFLK